MTKTERNQRLLAALYNGCPDARDQLIKENMPLVFYCVKQYLIRNKMLRYLQADLIGAGLLGLVEAVNQIQSGASVKVNLGGYLYTTIRNTIQKLLNHEPLMRVPASSRSHARKRGRSLTNPRVSGLQTNNPVAKDSTLEIDALDLLNSVCESAVEQTALQMRVNGYTLVEIAEATGLTVYLLRRLVAKLRKRAAPLYQNNYGLTV